MSEEFRVLTDREHVLARAGVYVGSVVNEPITGIIDYGTKTMNVVPALIKCVEELIQNSIDEHVRTGGDWAKTIDVAIQETLGGTVISVADTGRGIPIEAIGDTYRPVLAWTELRAGSNFDDGKRIGAGTNGMGSALVAIFSEEFIGSTCDGKNKIVVTCRRNMETKEFKISPSRARGTKVQFTPDLSRFGLTEFTPDHSQVIEDRVRNLAINYPGIVFSFNGTAVRFKNIKSIAANFHPQAIPVETDNGIYIIAPSGASEEFLSLSYVNGIHIRNGGTHVDVIVNNIISPLRELIRKKHKIEVAPNQIRQHILFASWIRDFLAPRFDSQSKERITNTVAECVAVIGNLDYEKLARTIANTPEIIDPMIAAILFKKEREEAAELAKKLKKSAKIRVVGHIAATDPDPEKRTLLLAEGNSAIGALIKVRNPKTTGGYALRGKVMNVRGMRPVEIVKNKEIFEMLSIIGLELGKPAENMNYGRIVVFTDRDLDGEHIFALLLNLFSLWPTLFTEGRVYRMLSPLYYCTRGKQVRQFYDKAEFDQFDSKGWTVDYFKGLGSMPESVYDDCVNNPKLIRVIPDDLDRLEMAFGDSADLRKKWMIDEQY